MRRNRRKYPVYDDHRNSYYHHHFAAVHTVIALVLILKVPKPFIHIITQVMMPISFMFLVDYDIVEEDSLYKRNHHI